MRFVLCNNIPISTVLLLLLLAIVSNKDISLVDATGSTSDSASATDRGDSAAAAAAEVNNDDEQQQQQQGKSSRELRFGIGMGGGGIPFGNTLRATTRPTPLQTILPPAGTVSPKPTPGATTAAASPKPTPTSTSTTNTDADTDTVVDILENATVTLDPRYKWTGSPDNVIRGTNKYQDFMNYPSTSFSHCLFRTEFAPYIQIDLLEPKLVYGITLWHYWGDQRQYCSQGIRVSTNGETWNTIFDTIQKYGPAESPDGQHYTFAAQVVRYIRHFAGPSTLNSAVHFLRVEVDGKELNSDDSGSSKDGSGGGGGDDDSDKMPLRLAVSNNGKDLFATQNGKTYEYDKEEEEWNQIFEDTWFQQVALDPDHLVAVVNVVGQVLLVGNDTEPHSWEVIQKDPQKDIAYTTEGGIWSINEDGEVSCYKDGVWTIDTSASEHNFVHIAANHKGEYLVALSDEGKPFLKRTASTDKKWLEQDNLPEDAPKFVRVTIGGSHEVWFTSEDGKVYHAWIAPPPTAEEAKKKGTASGDGVPSKLHDWERVDNKLQQITATRSGTIWGVSMDGMGVLYCPNRNPERHSFRCQYVIGPLGASVA